jgi:CAAX prenyl protease-like protein
MTVTSFSRYWREAREPRYSLSFAFPLLVIYEALAITLSHGEVTGVRNGADVLLKSVFLMLGGRDGLAVFGLLLVGGGAALVWRDLRRSGQVRPGYFVGMLLESSVYALTFGLVAGALTVLLLPGLSVTWKTLSTEAGAAQQWNLATQLMISLGAGIYEELLFRVLLVSGLVWLARVVFGWAGAAGKLFAVGAGALIFSAFHYVGPYGESLELGSFTFRTVAGVLFSGLYVVRGFGITAWTHALYDVFLTI